MFKYTLTRQKLGVYPDVEQETIEITFGKHYSLPTQLWKLQRLLDSYKKRTPTPHTEESTRPDYTSISKVVVFKKVNCNDCILYLKNQTNNTISTLQQEVTNLSKVIKQNRLTLNLLLTSKGGICTVINTSYCVYVDQTLRIQTNLGENRKNTGSLHEIQNDQETNIFNCVTSWIPNLNTFMRKLIGIIIVVLTLMFSVQVMF